MGIPTFREWVENQGRGGHLPKNPDQFLYGDKSSQIPTFKEYMKINGTPIKEITTQHHNIFQKIWDGIINDLYFKSGGSKMGGVIDNASSLLGAFIGAIVITRMTYLFIGKRVSNFAQQSVIGFVVGAIICIIFQAWINLASFILLFILDVSGVTHKSSKSKITNEMIKNEKI